MSNRPDVHLYVLYSITSVQIHEAVKLSFNAANTEAAVSNQIQGDMW